MKLDVAILVLLVIVVVVVSWTAATIYAVHRDIQPLLSSALVRTVAGIT